MWTWDSPIEDLLATAWGSPPSREPPATLLQERLIVPVQYAIAPLPDVRMSPPAADGIVTMPPALPNTRAPFATIHDSGLARGVRKIGSDYANLYSCDSLVCVTAAFGAGALMANTGFDTTMQKAWQQGVAPTSLGTFFSDCKPMGEGAYALPVFGAAAATGILLDNTLVGDTVGEWGSRSLRMFIVGAPPLYVLQMATGASRPDQDVGSKWHFLNDNNGVSGHAFIGGIPSWLPQIWWRIRWPRGRSKFVRHSSASRG